MSFLTKVVSCTFVSVRVIWLKHCAISNYLAWSVDNVHCSHWLQLLHVSMFHLGWKSRGFVSTVPADQMFFFYFTSKCKERQQYCFWSNLCVFKTDIDVKREYILFSGWHMCPSGSLLWHLVFEDVAHIVTSFLLGNISMKIFFAHIYNLWTSYFNLTSLLRNHFKRDIQSGVWQAPKVYLILNNSCYVSIYRCNLSLLFYDLPGYSGSLALKTYLDDLSIFWMK